METVTKQCKQCRLVKPLADFAKNHRLKDGHEFTCKLCKNARGKEIRKGKADGTYVSMRPGVQPLRDVNPQEKEKAIGTHTRTIEGGNGKGVNIGRLACAIRVVKRVMQHREFDDDAQLVADVYAEMQTL